MSEHHTDYEVFSGTDECKCVKPSEEDEAAFELYEENHPSGEGLDEVVTICKLTPLGKFCQECSQDSGDWVPHIVYCDDCGYEDCQCEVIKEMQSNGE